MDPESAKGLPPVSLSPKEVFSHSPDQPDAVHHDYYPNFFELLSQTLSLFINNFFRLIIIQIINLLIIVLAIIPGVLGGAVLSLVSLPIPIIVIIAIIYVIFLFYISFWIQTVPIYFISRIDQNPSLSHIFRGSSKKALTYIWLSILSAFLIFGGSILLIIPGIILSLYSVFAPFVLMAEEQSGFTALHLSRHYLSGHFWGFIWRQLLFALVVIFFIVIIIFLQENQTTAIIGQVFGFIGQLVISTIYFIYLRQNYVALRWLKIDKQLVVSKKMSTLYILLTILPIILIAIIIFLASSNLANIIPTIAPSIINQLPRTLVK